MVVCFLHFGGKISVLILQRTTTKPIRVSSYFEDFRNSRLMRIYYVGRYQTKSQTYRVYLRHSLRTRATLTVRPGP